MSALVVDCNVVAAANGRAEHVSVECRLSCVRCLGSAGQNIVVLDEERLILREYGRYGDHTGQGAGDAFLNHLHVNFNNGKCCERVQLTLRNRNAVGETADDTDFAEFPDTEELAKFDRSDRKYVAVACGSKNDPEIVYASDRGWNRHKDALDSCGVRIRHLCPGRP